MEYDEKQVQEAVDEALKDFKFGSFLDSMSKIPDMICLNCGRCVMVGRCCSSPNKVIMQKEEVSPEVWDKIQDLIKNPPEPTKKLIELMNRNKL